jgi:hypothetical protein
LDIKGFNSPVQEEKGCLYGKAKKSGKSRDWNYYRKLNSMDKKDCNSARRMYINDLVDELRRNNAKPFWISTRNVNLPTI